MADKTETPPPAAESTPPPEPSAADLAKDARIQALEAHNAELQRTSEFWHSRASERPAAAAAPAATATPEPEEDEDLLDLITTKGVKGLDALMTKRGYVRRDEVDHKVNAKATQVTDEARLVAQYPELNDNKSDFFMATATRYGTLVKNGTPEHMAMRLAAEGAELEMIRAGKMQTPAEKAAATKAQRETERLAHVAAQGGDRGGRTTDQEESDELTAEQRAVAIRMLAVDGVTEEQAIERYKARAKKGVAMKGGIESNRRAA